MFTTTTTTMTTMTTRDRGDRYGPIEWAQKTKDDGRSVIFIIIIIIKFFNKKVVKRNFTNGEENRLQIIVNNYVYTKLLSRNVVRSDHQFLV